MDEEVYAKLREFLDKMPGGFPRSGTGVEIRILKKLFTVEQARILLHMTTMPESASSISDKMGMKKNEVEEKIELMAQRGLIFRVRIEKEPYYLAVSFAVGIFEFQLNAVDTEFSRLYDEYLPYIAKDWSRLKTQQLRILPVESSVGSNSTIQPYNHIKELIKNKELIGLAHCICSKEKESAGEKCTRFTERCITFDIGAQYYIENKMARKISLDECMHVLQMGEEQALVLTVSNAKEINNICLCCGCCCGNLKVLKLGGRAAEQMQSSFYAWIDPGTCISCGICKTRCQIDALKENRNTYEVIGEQCIGCGLCVSTCPSGAISLLEKPNYMMSIPDSVLDMQARINAERLILRQ